MAASFGSKFSKFAGEAKSFLEELAAGLSVFYVTVNYVGFGSTLVGPSMLPTFAERGDLVVYDAFSHQIMHKDYKIGDVVIARCPYDPDKMICKRIAAVATDDVVINPRSFYPSVVRIPRGHVWLAGDNPDQSTDSRSYGPVSTGLIRGRVVLKFHTRYPFYSFVKTTIEGREKTKESAVENSASENSVVDHKVEAAKLRAVLASVMEGGVADKSEEEVRRLGRLVEMINKDLSDIQRKIEQNDNNPVNDTESSGSLDSQNEHISREGSKDGGSAGASTDI